MGNNMYLISLYFEEKTSQKIQKLINKAACKSGNDFMINGRVPPHITISAFETYEIHEIINALEEKVRNIKSGDITWASIGIFKSSVIFLTPVLNKYLHNISAEIYDAISVNTGISISRYYRPFQWMPHTTIAKKLTREQLYSAFEELNRNFTIFNGKVTQIGLSKTNPYEDIIVWNLK